MTTLETIQKINQKYRELGTEKGFNAEIKVTVNDMRLILTVLEGLIQK